MKQQITSSIQELMKDRYLTVLLTVFLLSCISLLVFLVTAIHPSELQVVVHYTSFGATNFYRDKWYYLLSFGGFVIIMAAVHSVLTYRIFRLKGHQLAVAFTWLGILMVAVTIALFLQIVKIASLS